LSLRLYRLKRSARVCGVVVFAAPLALSAHAAGNPAAPARAAASLTSVDEYGSLQMQSHKGSTISEKGIGWGTFNCSVVIALTLSGTLVTANYTAFLQGGSISGTATARIHSATTRAAAFSGTISLRRGTGSRARASGTASFSGTINRTSYAMTTHINGRLQL
jgi:hypothetical protein